MPSAGPSGKNHLVHHLIRTCARYIKIEKFGLPSLPWNACAAIRPCPCHKTPQNSIMRLPCPVPVPRSHARQWSVFTIAFFRGNKRNKRLEALQAERSKSDCERCRIKVIQVYLLLLPSMSYPEHLTPELAEGQTCHYHYSPAASYLYSLSSTEEEADPALLSP